MELQGNDYHSFPAVRGVQAGRLCYIAMCPMRLISNLFLFEDIWEIKKIDWRRDNPEWKNRTISNGRISKAKINVALTVNLIKKKLSLSLSKREREIEREHGSAD